MKMYAGTTHNHLFVIVFNKSFASSFFFQSMLSLNTIDTILKYAFLVFSTFFNRM